MAPVLHLLTGSTASGKSALAVVWAQANNAEILSCDALQVYRGMDIGTAKPTARDRALVPHHGLDLSDIACTFSIAEYRDYAARTVAEIHARGKNVLVVGGSGFYLKSFFAPVADDVDISPGVEAKVAALEKSGGLPALIQALREASPTGTGKVDLLNPRRVARALARCLASGRTVTELAEQFARSTTPFDGMEKKLVRVDRELPELTERIRARTKKMLADNLITEVRKILAALRSNPAAASAIGYRETIMWIESGELAPTTELEEAITTHTLQLVRKQRTWFRTQLPPHKIVELKYDASPDVESLFS